MPELQLSDAINQDVSDPQEAPKSARELAMEKIAGDHVTRVRESGDFDGMDEDIDPDNPDADQVALQAPAEPAAPRVSRIKVDGEERDVTDDELIRSYQKNVAADRRLEEASRLLREANERTAQLAAQFAAPPQITQHEAPSQDFRAEVKSVLSKLYEGDEENASAALADLLMKSRGGDQPTPSPSIDLNQLTLQVQENMAIDSAFASLQTDYPELISNPDLEELTAAKVTRAIANGTPRAQAILDSAAEVYKLIGKEPAGRQQETPKPTSNSRMDNKQKLDLVRPASGVAASKSTPVEENASSVIEEMAARRLGQSIARRAA